MKRSFQFSATPKIIFENGGLSRLPGIATGFGSRMILVTGSKSFSGSKQFSALSEALEGKKIDFRIIRIPGEPTPEMIDEAVSAYRHFNTDLVVAIGGGSVMDAGKAISAMLTVDGSIVDFLEDVGIREHVGTKVPFIAVPTTSGTGSEATKNAVISRIGKNGFKKSLRHDNFVPDIALIDPILTLGCPPSITASGGMDCFSQLVEAYLSTKSGVYTDVLAIEAIKAVKLYLLRAYNDGADIDARTGMSFAALTSGICLANAGLGAVHGFASSIGGLYDIPHGLVCGTLMAITNEINVRKLLSDGSENIALKKYADLGRLFLEDENKSDEYYINGFIGFLHELTENLNLRGLKEAGVRKEDIPAISVATGMKNNPVKLEISDITEILERKLT